MIRDDLDITIELLEEKGIDNLSEEQKNMYDRLVAIKEFDKIQEQYNNDRKAFDEKMKALNTKAGE